MMLVYCSSGMRPSQPQQFPPRCHPSWVGRHIAQVHHLGSVEVSIQIQIHKRSNSRGKPTSIKQKLGVGSSPSGQKPVLIAPVALPGFTKKRPSISKASNRCVPPHSKTSTSICRAAMRSESASPGGIRVWPWVNPIRRLPCVTTLERGRFGESTSKSPFTSCKSGAIWRKNSKVLRSVRLPKQRIWPIFPGVNSFRNCVMSAAKRIRIG